MTYSLEKYTLTQLKEIATELGIKTRRNKADMIKDISSAFQEYEEYRETKLEKYKKLKQIGNKGKEGITFLVETKNGDTFAMKTFRKTKSSQTLKKEYKLQKKAGKAGIAPKVIDYDTVSKYIVMEKMDKHLLDVIQLQKGVLLKYQQKRILEIFQGLDEIKVFHGDANLANYMLKGKQIYLIDYGFAKEIDDRLIKNLKTETPNLEFMLLGFVLKLKEFGCDLSNFNYLTKKISEKNREKFGIN